MVRLSIKKINRASELLWLFGILFVALGVAICNKASLGVSMIAAPAFIIAEAISPILPFFSVGVVEYVFQGALLLLLCLVVRRFRVRYLFAFAVAVIYGYVLNLFILVVGDAQPDSVAMRWLLLVIGDFVTAFGVACFFRTYMPLQVYELFVSEIADRFGFDIGRVKWAFDLSLLALSLILAVSLFGGLSEIDTDTLLYASYHSIGLGTVFTTLINSPIITVMGRLIDKIFVPTPLLPKLRDALCESGN